MDARHHYHQYWYYLNKAYAHRKIYKQCRDNAAYHLRICQIFLNKTHNNTPSEQDTGIALISTMHIKSELIDVEYPYVSGLSSPDIETQINDEIRSLVEQMIRDQTPPGSKNTGITGRYEIPLNQANLLSIRFENYAYTPPAAHGLTIVRSLTFDLKTGHIYSFDDLFDHDSSYQDLLNQIIETQIKERDIPLITEFTGISENQEYYLKPDSMIIYFQLYELAPYVYGILEFEIPYQSIEDIINPTGPIAMLL